MPTTKKVTEYKYKEFDKLCIETLHLPYNWSCVPAFEWNNYESHQFSLDADELEKINKWERQDMDKLYHACDGYVLAVAQANGSVEPLSGYTHETKPAPAIDIASRAVWDAAVSLYTITLCLMELQALTPGEYIINISW